MACQLLLGCVPSVIMLKVFLIAVDDPGELLSITLRVMRSLQLFTQFLPFVLSDVNRVAAMASTVLASMRWQPCPALISWHLTKTGFPLLAERLHALTTTSILDDEAIMLLSKAIFLCTVVTISMMLTLLSFTLILLFPGFLFLLSDIRVYLFIFVLLCQSNTCFIL